MTALIPALALIALMLIALRCMPKVRRGEQVEWNPDKAIDARPHLRIADDSSCNEDYQSWDARFQRWQERPMTIDANDPEVSKLLEKGRYEEP
jgi:hypothetical protein